MHAHTLGCMEACAIRVDVRFVVLRQRSHTMAHMHLLQHLFAVVAQLLVGEETTAASALELAPMEKHARCTHTSTYGVPRHGGGASPVASTPSAHVVYQGGCMPNDDVGEIF